MRLAIALALLVGAVFLALYGLLLILYEGDSRGGNTTVTLAGRVLDADRVGAAALVAALAVGLVAPGLVRRP